MVPESLCSFGEMIYLRSFKILHYGIKWRIRLAEGLHGSSETRAQASDLVPNTAILERYFKHGTTRMEISADSTHAAFQRKGGKERRGRDGGRAGRICNCPPVNVGTTPKTSMSAADSIHSTINSLNQ